VSRLGSEEDRDFIRSLAKGLAVIEAFSASAPSMTVSEVARAARLSPGSAHRVLKTLERLGYLGVNDGRYSLLPRTLQLGYAYLSTLPLASLVQPKLSELTQALDESCSVAMLQGRDIIIVARSAAKRLAQDYLAVGSRLPGHATSFGKILLAALPERELKDLLAQEPLQRLTSQTICRVPDLLQDIARARKLGWAMNDQESIMGLRSIAVPIHLHGRVYAGLGLSAEVVRLNRKQMIERFVPALKDAAVMLSRVISSAAV
jgi:IclR family pca regulon transcriptional regulator